MKVVLITPAHNEEKVIEGCIESVKEFTVPRGVRLEHVVVLDRCTDRTEEICRAHGVRTIRKDFRGEFLSPIAEAIQFGIDQTDGEIIGVIDADIRAPKDALVKLLSRLGGKVACVSADVRTRSGKWWLDALMRLRDLNYKIAPLGREPRGALRLFYRRVVEEIGGLDPDKPTFDTAFDMKLRAHGYDSILVPEVVAIEYRPDLSVTRIVRRQISDGRARKRLGIGIVRTAAHSLFRFRPFVIVGYVLETISS